MQIFGIEDSAFFRNRLTHSLEVAQIAHSIAAEIGDKLGDKCSIYKDDLFVIDAAALAHDIGHPAFGHKGEQVLDEIAKSVGKRFEGNAQNFRVLRTLEKKEPSIQGLNLTNRTLLAINKYVVCEDKNVKKFMFKDDYEYLEEVRKKAGLQNRRTLDVQIIELADDIAYSVHDLEDGLAFRYFSIDELLYAIKKDDEQSYNKLKEIVDNAKKYALNSSSYDTIQEYSQVFRKRLVSDLTYKFVNDIVLNEVSEEDSRIHGTDNGQMELQLDEYKYLCKHLKETIYKCATRDTNIAMYEAKGEVILKSLYSVLSDEKINKKSYLLPPDYRPKTDYSLQQGCIDYLAGMMDNFAIGMYEQFWGTSYENVVIKNAIIKDYDYNKDCWINRTIGKFKSFF
jgi:dGTPase